MFNEIEGSRYSGCPIELYRFQSSDFDFRYTSSQSDYFSPDGIVYKALPITRSANVASGSMDKSVVTLELPTDSEIPPMFIDYPPQSVINVTVSVVHANDASGQPSSVWGGKILSCDIGPEISTVYCEPMSSSMRRQILTRHYQYGCPHLLYGDQCRANRSVATFPAVCLSWTGSKVTFASDPWHPAIERFLGGVLEWDYEGKLLSRTIRSTDSSSVTLSAPPYGLVYGQYVNVVYGCKKTMDDCSNVHYNILNFGGQPWIPTDNPFNSVNQFF